MLNVFGRRLRYGISVAALMAGTQAALLLNAYGGEGMAMVFSGAEPSIKIVDSTTPSNDWDSAWGDGYSVQDFFKSRSFTSYSGPVSTGKRLMQADGYIKPCRHNLLNMSNKFESAAWVAANLTITPNSAEAPDGTMTAALLSPSANPSIYNSLLSAPGGGLPVTFSIYLKSATGSSFSIAYYANGSGVNPNPTTGTLGTVTTSWQRFSVTVTCAASSATINFALGNFSSGWASGNNVYAWGAQVNAGSQALDYVSSEAHNLLTYSEQAASGRTLSAILAFGAGSTTNSATAPDGTTTADLMVPSTANSAHNDVASYTAVATSMTVTRYAKAGGYSRIGLREGSVTGAYATFLLSGSGSVLDSGSGGSGTITSVGNGWYRCSMTYTGTAASHGWRMYIMDDSYTTGTPSGYSYAGDGASGVYVWGAQVELASSPGKYVATTSAAVYNQHFDLPVEFNTDGTVKALTREEARTNLALYSNNLTNAAWTKSNMSTAMTATGADGASNSATTCTATAANATVLQAITSASSARITSAYIKRRTGSGNIDMTQDNGATWTTVSVTSSWTRLNIASVTSTNPTVGLRIVTSGDAIDVMYFQHEAAATISSVIATGSAAVTRAADVITWPTTIFPYNDSVGTWYAKHFAPSNTVAGARIISDNVQNRTMIQMRSTTYYGYYDGTTNTTNTDATLTLGTTNKVANAYSGSAGVMLSNAGIASSTSFDGAFNVTTVLLGMQNSGTNDSNCPFSEIMYVPSALSDSSMQTLTTP